MRTADSAMHLELAVQSISPDDDVSFFSLQRSVSEMTEMAAPVSLSATAAVPSNSASTCRGETYGSLGQSDLPVALASGAAAISSPPQ